MIRKLGIVVVYLVKRENDALLDLHFSQIEKCINVPYRIYGSINRLLPEFRSKVAGQPMMKICDCPTTDHRSDNEQIHYLEHLIRAAIEDGCSHILTLHVDSFPIRSDLVQTLAKKLETGHLFAMPSYGNYTSCLFFESSFYLRYEPKFILSGDELASREYWEFCKNFDHIPHAGIGFSFLAYRKDFSWFPLAETQIKKARFVFHGNIYNDLVYHLNAAAYPENDAHMNTCFIGLRKWLWRHIWVPAFRIVLLSKTQQRARGARRLPRRLISWSWRHIGFPLFYKPINCHVRNELLGNPDSYLRYLRTGERDG